MMTARELMKILSDCSPEAEVRICVDDEYTGLSEEVSVSGYNDYKNLHQIVLNCEINT